jgi:hypothetical protein
MSTRTRSCCVGQPVATRADEIAGTRSAVNAPHLVALVRAGARFDKGVLVEREQVPAA